MIGLAVKSPKSVAEGAGTGTLTEASQATARRPSFPATLPLMDDELKRLRREVRSLRRLLMISYPYVPWDAHGPRFQDALERAVMGDAWVEKVRATFSERPSPSASLPGSSPFEH